VLSEVEVPVLSEVEVPVLSEVEVWLMLNFSLGTTSLCISAALNAAGFNKILCCF
jgi:hypothetical protein